MFEPPSRPVNPLRWKDQDGQIHLKILIAAQMAACKACNNVVFDDLNGWRPPIKKRRPDADTLPLILREVTCPGCLSRPACYNAHWQATF